MDRPVDPAKLTLLKPARALRQSREARVGFWRACIVTAFFAIVLSTNLFVGAVVVFGNIRTHAEAENAVNKTGRIKRPMLDGEFCRFTVFDNKSALTLEDRVERCDAAGLTSDRKGKDFTWGGK